MGQFSVEKPVGPGSALSGNQHFRGLWHRRAKKIAKIGSLRDHRKPRIEFLHGLQDIRTV
jgi:hypothetical protein